MGRYGFRIEVQLEAVLTGKDTADKGDIVQAIGNDYTLLRNCADFKGIWAGSDESGKGDFFGPLVVAAVLVDITTAEKLVRLGVRDCKLINDKEVLRLAELIVEAAPINTVLALKPEMYNFRYQQMRADGKNLNHLLSNGHIAVLRNVLRQCPQCNYALVDQFTASNDIRASLQQEFPDVNIVQQHRAEADIAVAAASVLARAKFLEIMQELAEQVGRNELPKGGSDAATNCARELLKELGRGALERLVKVHFANYKKSRAFQEAEIYEKLIVNADDFGLHPAINAGIIKGCRDGFITSTSLMCSGAAFDDAVLQAKATPVLGVGIHLTLVGGGKPLLQARQLRTLVDEDGLLPADYTVFAKRWYAGRIKKQKLSANCKHN